MSAYRKARDARVVSGAIVALVVVLLICCIL